MSGDERLSKILGAIIDQYDAQPPEHRTRLLHLRMWQDEGFHDWDESLPKVTREDLDDLHDEGFIDLDFGGGDGNYLVKPSAVGRAALGRYRRERARAESKVPVDLSWPAVRPALHAAVDVWERVGAPMAGYIDGASIARELGASEDDIALARKLEVLGAGDWLDVDYEGDEHLPHVRPTMRGVMATRAWPGGDAEVAAERLLSALDEVERSSADETQRGWAKRARDTLMEVGTKTLAEVVSKSVGTAL